MAACATADKQGNLSKNMSKLVVSWLIKFYTCVINNVSTKPNKVEINLKLFVFTYKTNTIVSHLFREA
jgi:hypothetical protein